MREIWVPVNGLEGDYEISSYGKLKTLPNQNSRKLRIRNATIWQYDYPRFTLKGRKILAARLVAEHFLDNPDNLKYIKYKDGDADNIKADNLYWSKSTRGEYTKKKRREKLFGYIQESFDGVFTAKRGAWMDSSNRTYLKYKQNEYYHGNK